MRLVCLDMEGVLLPEIWIEIAQMSGIDELRRTTRDEPDYDKLMRQRLQILREHDLGMPQIQGVLAAVEPLPGAREFLDELRTFAQVIIISDTFTQFLEPVLHKLNRPTVFCNELVIDDDGFIADYRMRCNPTKLTTVQALQSCGFETVASGDSFNDLAMIKASSAGFLYRTTDAIKAANPDVPTCESLPELLEALKGVL